MNRRRTASVPPRSQLVVNRFAIALATPDNGGFFTPPEMMKDSVGEHPIR